MRRGGWTLFLLADREGGVAHVEHARRAQAGDSNQSIRRGRAVDLPGFIPVVGGLGEEGRPVGADVAGELDSDIAAHPAGTPPDRLRALHRPAFPAVRGTHGDGGWGDREVGIAGIGN